MKKYYRFFYLCGIFLFLLYSFAEAQNKNPDEQQFITHMIHKYHFSRLYLEKTLEHAAYIPKIVPIIQKPYEERSWNFYKALLVSNQRIQSGVEYWKNHTATLAKIKKQYGVDPSVIVAIIGIETYYGKAKGRYQELGALSTLAFHYPTRGHFFEGELEQFFLLARHNHLPILAIQGSYAGALGIPQFMPSSYISYGVDYNKDHHVDLLQNDSDAIASIANFLKHHGWKINQPIAMHIISIKKIPTRFLAHGSKAQLTFAQFKKYGVDLPKRFAINQKMAIITLHNLNSNEYWIAFPNFKTLHAYNASVNYVMAIYQLSSAIKKEYEKRTAA